MFTSNHFELTREELREVAQSPGVAALRAAMRRTMERLMHQVLQVEGPRLDIYRGAALILLDMDQLLEAQIAAAKQKSSPGREDESRIYEV